LDAQADLDRVPAGGLVIFANAANLPTAYVAADGRWMPSVDTTSPSELAARPVVRVERLRPPGAPIAGRAAAPGEAVASDQFDPGWRIVNDGERLAPRRAFGWAIAASVRAGEVSFVYADQWMRSVEMVVLAIVWLAALWITRKPGSA
jgi:hypothetical protein